MPLEEALRANGTRLRGSADETMTVKVDESTATVWTDLRPRLAANVLRDIANDLDEIARRNPERGSERP